MKKINQNVLINVNCVTLKGSQNTLSVQIQLHQI
jgi:hypothetical protein